MIWKYMLIDNADNKAHSRAGLTATIKPLLNQGSQFSKKIRIIVKCSVTNCDPLKIQTETVY